jgi:hypothetical protein
MAQNLVDRLATAAGEGWSENALSELRRNKLVESDSQIQNNPKLTLAQKKESASSVRELSSSDLKDYANAAISKARNELDSERISTVGSTTAHAASGLLGGVWTQWSARALATEVVPNLVSKFGLRVGEEAANALVGFAGGLHVAVYAGAGLKSSISEGFAGFKAANAKIGVADNLKETAVRKDASSNAELLLGSIIKKYPNLEPLDNVHDDIASDMVHRFLNGQSEETVKKNRDESNKVVDDALLKHGISVQDRNELLSHINNKVVAKLELEAARLSSEGDDEWYEARRKMVPKALMHAGALGLSLMSIKYSMQQALSTTIKSAALSMVEKSIVSPAINISAGAANMFYSAAAGVKAYGGGQESIRNAGRSLEASNTFRNAFKNDPAASQFQFTEPKADELPDAHNSEDIFPEPESQSKFVAEQPTTENRSGTIREAIDIISTQDSAAVGSTSPETDLNGVEAHTLKASKTKRIRQAFSLKRLKSRDWKTIIMPQNRVMAKLRLKNSTTGNIQA